MVFVRSFQVGMFYDPSKAISTITIHTNYYKHCNTCDGTEPLVRVLSMYCCVDTGTSSICSSAPSWVCLLLIYGREDNPKTSSFSFSDTVSPRGFLSA